jgi:hypothetical protein
MIFDDGETENQFMIRMLYKTMRKHMDAVPTDQRNAETMAKAAYAGVRETCADLDMNPDIETFIRAPGEEAYDGTRDRWLVCWESGPYQWGSSISMALDYGLTEPYYSFDLSFYPSERYK